MAEVSRLDREHKRLATKMHIPPVDENLYIRSLGNGDIPYETQLSTFDNQNSKTNQPNTRLSTFDDQNSKTEQPDARLGKSKKQNSKAVRLKVPPSCSNLKDNYEQVNIDLPPTSPLDRADYFITDQTFRRMSPSTPFEVRTN